MKNIKTKTENAPYIISFDETLNGVIQEEQMDLQIRFFDDEIKQAVTLF